MIWLSDGETTWLAEAWDDETAADNGTGWDEAFKKATANADRDGYQWRVQFVRVPGVYKLFDVPEVTAEVER